MQIHDIIFKYILLLQNEFLDKFQSTNNVQTIRVQLWT